MNINGTHPNRRLFDLCLWLSGTMREEGECLSQHQIARNVSAAMKVLSGKDRGVSAEMIRKIELKAMRKIRAALYRDKQLMHELEGIVKL